MNTKLLAAIAVAVVAVAAVGGYMAFGGQNDGGDGGSDDGAPGSDATRLEYTADVVERPGCWDIYIKFSAPESGWLKLYLGDEQIVSSYGYPVEYEWTGSVSFTLDGLGFSIDFESGQDINYIKSNLVIVFSPNFDAVQIGSY